jgi:hypothetical protein
MLLHILGQGRVPDVMATGRVLWRVPASQSAREICSEHQEQATGPSRTVLLAAASENQIVTTLATIKIRVDHSKPATRACCCLA